MRNNRKITKAVISLLALIMLIVLLFFFLQKSNVKSDDNSKNKDTINTEEQSKDSQKTSEENPKTDSEKLVENPTSVTNEANKNQEADNALNKISNEQGITVFIKAASFGSTAEILIDSSKFNSSYKYYQFYLGNKPISNIESITKIETTIFPTQEAGSEVVMNLVDGNKKVLKKLNIILNIKK
jgi:hypothetical protein